MDRRSEFITERRFLLNVSPATVSWYEHALFKWLPSDSPSDAELKSMVVSMRQQGFKATGCNAAIRAINAYLKWSGSGLKVAKLKEPRMVMPAFTGAQVVAPSELDRRLHLLILLLFDCGLRISEALNIRVRDADLDAMLLLIDGKGAKQRRVPFSYELRKSLYRYVKDYDRKPEDWLLADKGGKKRLGLCVMLRNVKELCRKLGFEPPVRTIHAMRHTFGANYIRRGGSVYHLQACLGHPH
jgi:integrase/recombinase XerD